MYSKVGEKIQFLLGLMLKNKKNECCNTQDEMKRSGISVRSLTAAQALYYSLCLQNIRSKMQAVRQFTLTCEVFLFL